MKPKRFFSLLAFILAGIFLSDSFIACSNYFTPTPKNLLTSRPYQDISFENQYWEQSSDSSLATMELIGIGNNLHPDFVKSVTIIRKGTSIPAGYLNWGRENLYRYEIVNNRIILYWQIEDQPNFFGPVTVIIRLQ